MVVLVKENFKTALDYCHREYGHLDYCNNNGKSWLRRPLIRDSDVKNTNYTRCHQIIAFVILFGLAFSVYWWLAYEADIVFNFLTYPVEKRFKSKIIVLSSLN